MNSRQAIKAAIEGICPDRIPVVLPYIHLYLDHIVHELTGLSWAHRMYGAPEDRAEIYSLARTYFELDWLPIGGIGTSLNNITKKLTEENGVQYVEDTETGEKKPLPPEKPVDEPVTARMMDSVGDVDSLPPVLSVSDILGAGVLEPAIILGQKYGDEVMLAGGASMPGNQNYFYLGIYDMFTALKLEPELVHHLVERSRKMIIHLLEAQSHAGISCVWLEDNFVAGDLISREDYETFFHQANADIIDAARRFGLYTIYYLTGDVMSRIPHILDMNPDCLAFEESKKTFIVDPVEVRKAAGDRICLLGNIDAYADIEKGDHAVWEQALSRQLEAACPQGKFILSAGSPITHDTPKETVRDFVRFARNYAGNRIHKDRI